MEGVQLVATQGFSTSFSPSDFILKFPSTRLIVDGTEIPVQKHKHPVAQRSTYKYSNTVKVLVGCSPDGLVSYLFWTMSKYQSEVNKTNYLEHMIFKMYYLLRRQVIS